MNTKREVAEILFPLYRAWHIACLDDYASKKTNDAERTLWMAVSNHPNLGLPTKITASIGRWCARQMKISITAQEWYSKHHVG